VLDTIATTIGIAIYKTTNTFRYAATFRIRRRTQLLFSPGASKRLSFEYTPFPSSLPFLFQ
jgi:hypothetical protein